MKRSKSGAQKRKEAATARDAVAKLPKMTDFFKITEQSRPGTSTERDEENYSVQEKEDYDDQHQSDCEFPENVSCDLPANTQPLISKITESQFTPIPDDPCKWPESISDAQRCDIVKRGPHQLIMNFPYNNTTPRRRFSSNHYKRVLPNGSAVALQLRAPPKVSARAPAHRSYHFRGVKLAWKTLKLAWAPPQLGGLGGGCYVSVSMIKSLILIKSAK